MIFPNLRPNRRFSQRHPHLFQSFDQKQPFNRGPNTGGFLKGFTNTRSIASVANKGVNGLSKTLNNVQQVMNVVQSAAPVVQEYGPIVKNLPAMYRMMKSLKSVDTDDVPKELPEENEHKQSQQPSEFSNEKSNEYRQESVNEKQGKSIPKLFI